MGVKGTVNFLLVSLEKDKDKHGATRVPTQSSDQSNLFVCRSF